MKITITITIIIYLLLNGYRGMAEIIKTDSFIEIQPNENTANNKLLDIDRDSNYDFIIEVNNIDNNKNVRIGGLSKNNQILGLGDENNISEFFCFDYSEQSEIWSENDEIWNNFWDDEWMHPNNIIIKSNQIDDEPWDIVNDFKFLGIRIEKNGNYYYGWIKLKVSERSNSCIIDSYAIETEPNKAIITPSLSSVIKDRKSSEYIVYPNPTEDILNISLFNCGCIIEVMISNVITNNVCVFRPVVKSSSLSIDINDFAPGVYLINIKSNQCQFTDKIIKVK
jgi:hypothetical protein